MAVLQSIPSGYLSLLGIKAGANPGQAADFVQPVLAVDPFYLASAINSLLVTTAGATNVGDNAIITIPSGETWRLLSLGGDAFAFSAPAPEVRFSLQVLEPTNRVTAPIFSWSDVITAATDLSQNGVLFPQPVAFPPGTVFRLSLLNDLGAVTCTIGVRAMFQRLVV